MFKKLKKVSKSRTKLIAVVSVLFIGMVFASVLLGTIAIDISYGDEDSHARSVADKRETGSKLATSTPSEPIYINDAGTYNWTWAKAQSLCSGSGTLIDPYVIEDLTIDCGGSGSGIFIENSNAYFRIENCTVYNSGRGLSDAGIKLYNTDNGYIIGCFSSQNYNGIYLCLSDNNTVAGNTVNNSVFGIYLYWDCDNNTVFENSANYNLNGIELSDSDDNTVSGNTANYNYYGILLFGSYNNTVSGNTANYNHYGIYLFDGGGNAISENIANYNDYGIHLQKSNDNIVSRNILVGNVFFIEYKDCIDNIIKNNTCYTIILPVGINEFEVEPYGVDDIDVNISIALDNNTEVLFSAFSNNILDVPLDNELIFMNLQLNDTDNLNQTIDAPINITLEYDALKYKPLDAFWFNESANGGHGAWEEIPFTTLGNGIIIISLNHTSIFALKGDLKSIALSKGDDDNDDDINDEINIFLIVIIAIIIGLVSSIAASSTYYYKTRAMPTNKEILMKKPLVKSFDEEIVKSLNLKDYVENKNILKFLKEKNALEKLDLFDDLKINTVSNEFWEKIEDLEFSDKEEVEFINEILSFTPKERQEIIDEMLKLRESDLENAN